jgi:hypothetical protein
MSYAGYDTWKATNPDDEWLGPDPEDRDEEDEPPENKTDEEVKAPRPSA